MACYELAVCFAEIWINCCRQERKAESLNKFRRCYHKCIKVFFGYSKYHSVTAVLFDLKLPSFNTIMHNFRHVYSAHWWSSGNMLIINLRNIGIVPMCSWCVLLTVFVLLFVCACIYILFYFFFLLFTFRLRWYGFLPEMKIDWLIDWKALF